MSRARNALVLGLLCAVFMSFTLLGAPRAEEQDSTQAAGYSGYSLSTGGGLSTRGLKYETGGAGMAIDGLVVRPISFVGTVLGSVVFVATLPFSALGGNVGEAADLLVLEPAKFTFSRCLGCWPDRY